MFEYNETLEQARQRNIHDALMEDIGTGDWTAKLVPSKPVKAQLIVRQEAVLCGVDWFEGTLKKLDPNSKVTWHYLEGDMMKPDTKVCDIEADSQALLSAERTCINFLQTLSWTASITRQHVDAIAGTRYTQDYSWITSGSEVCSARWWREKSTFSTVARHFD